MALGAVLSLTACGDDGGSADSQDETETSSGTGMDTMMSGTESGTDGTGGPEVELEPAPGGMRKMVAREYVKTIEVMFGFDAAAAAIPPDDVPQEGFDAVGGWVLSLPTEAIENYERSATAVADAVVADPSTLAETVPCVDGMRNDACYTTVAETIGRWAYRRTLEQAEIDSLVEIALEGRSWGDGDFLAGLKYQLMALLQSPSFVYIVQVGEPETVYGYRQLRPEELATRMSFFLTGHSPDLSLLDLADNGGLDSPEQIRQQAREMIQAPEARLATAAFFDEALRLRDVPEAPKSEEIFPRFSPELGEYMRQETLLLLHDIIWNRDSDIRELVNSRRTYVNDPLAELYGMDPPGEGTLFVEVDWPANQNRAGYMSQASFLTVLSGPNRNSPTERGRYVQEMLLCEDIPPPDPDAILDLPEPTPGQTLKELLEQHMENDGCRACHEQMDPIGFAFEGFDAIGQFRTMDNGSPITTDGEVATIGSWNNAVELGDVLANDPRVPRCLIENLIKGQLGHGPEAGEDAAIDAIHDRVADNGHSFQTLMVEFASSPLFRIINEPK